jgi:sucrose-6-phosphate hydrolase SacC (GH32 family)
MRRLLNLVVVVLATSTSLSAQSGTYDQPFRPQVHFSPQHNWTNDPNGLVYFNGEYHLFFQYNPFGDQWGHMSWGHAVSSDMLHWRELPVAIPEQGTEMVFTGSVVIDEHNTSGLCANNKPCMVAVYTGHHTTKPLRQNQNLAYSNDNGRTWKRYTGNPVLDLNMSDFRDPSVLRDEAHQRWVMAVALPNEHKVLFYSSPDLKQWTRLSEFGPTGATGGQWECPTLIRVPSDKGSGEMWALKVGINPGGLQGGSGEQYFLGSFDGTAFTASTKPGAHGWTNYGKDDYCAISFNHLPAGHKPVLLGWMSNWDYASKLPTSPWRGQMSLPRELSYIADSLGLALRQEPVTAALRGAHAAIASSATPTREAPFEMDVTFGTAAHGTEGVRLYSDEQHFTEIAFDGAKQQFYIDRTHSGLDPTPQFATRTTTAAHSGRPHDLQIIVDRSSVEAFAQDGTIAMTDLIFPPSRSVRIMFFSSGGKPQVKGDLWALKSIW